MSKMRTLPFLPGILLSSLLLAAIGLFIWLEGGLAFSPGELSAKNSPGIALQGFQTHADFEARCKLCHAPFETTQDTLCIACHAQVGRQIQAQNATHGHISTVSQCAACHTDHLGREFDPTQPALAKFDHSRTRFSLVWHQVSYAAQPMGCPDCHQIEASFLTSSQSCIDCHASQEAGFILQHVQEFGEGCLACHDGQDSMVNFDHQATRFPLDGRHQEAACSECHRLSEPPASLVRAGAGGSDQPALAGSASAAGAAGSPFKNTPGECFQCHDEPDIHLGMFSADCSTCHSVDSWMPAQLEGEPFEHTAAAGFSLGRHQLDYDNQPLICKDCHTGELRQFDQQVCSPCHSQGVDNQAFMSQHQEQFGAACLGCHDGVDRMSDFDHASFFPLDGRHAEIECEACHSGKVYAGTPSECVRCHAEPEVHAGSFGSECQRCHATSAWAPAQLRLHIFPLDHGGRGEIACQDCHATRYFEYTCYGCHDHQPAEITASHTRAGISLVDQTDCKECHPTGRVQNGP